MQFGEVGEGRGAIKLGRGKEQAQWGGEPSGSLHELLYLRANCVGEGTEKKLSVSNFLVPVLLLTRVVSMGLNSPCLPSSVPGLLQAIPGKAAAHTEKSGARGQTQQSLCGTWHCGMASPSLERATAATVTMPIVSGQALMICKQGGCTNLGGS